jgi:hypothetical protein
MLPTRSIPDLCEEYDKLPPLPLILSPKKQALKKEIEETVRYWLRSAWNAELPDTVTYFTAWYILRGGWE